MGAPVSGVAPSAQDLALLHVALDPPDQAAAAWRRLRPSFDLDDVRDFEVHRLFPRIHAALVRAGVDDPDLGRLKGVRRRAWYENQRLFRGAADLIALLSDAGIDTMALKGVAVATEYVDDVGLRPMTDADLLVPTDRRDDALAVIYDHGYQRTDPGAMDLTRYSVNLIDPDGDRPQVDLHWHPSLLLRPRPGPGPDFWDDAHPIEVSGANTSAPSPADLLLLTLVHGADWRQRARLRWIVDGVTIIARPPEPLVWSRVVQMASRYRVSLTVAQSLRFLRSEFGADVPDDALAQLDAVRVSPRDRLVHRGWTRPARQEDYPVVGGTPMALNRYLQHSHCLPIGAAAAGTVPFLMERWGIDHPRQLPGHVLRRARGQSAGSQP